VTFFKIPSLISNQTNENNVAETVVQKIGRLSKQGTSSMNKSETVVVMFDYQAKNDDELTLRPGQNIQVLSQDPGLSGDEGWWAGKIGNRLGVFPRNFVSAKKQLPGAKNSYQPLPDDYSPLESKYDVGEKPVLEVVAKKDKADFEFANVEVIHKEELDVQNAVGFGGFGTVYLGYYKNRKVAVKEFRHCASNDEEFLRSVKEEASTYAMGLSHKNIIGFEGLCLTRELPSIVLEFAEGGTLNKCLKDRILPPNIIVKWALQIASGMNYLHAAFDKPIIHRDLKSSNVLIKEPIEEDCEDLWNKTMKIADFGLARQTDITEEFTMGGTMAFMAPESIIKQKFSRFTDVWSYGVMLWEMLTGDQPYKDMEMQRICFGIGHNKLTLPIPNGCPDHLKELLQQCWSKEPHMRPSFATIISKLQTLAESDFVEIPISMFSDMQENWKVEVKSIIEDLRVKEQRLFEEYEEIQKEQERQRKIQKRLIKQIAEVHQREINVVAREMSLHNNNKKLENARYNKPRPPKRLGKFKRSKLLKLGGISEPSDFRHRQTVKVTDLEGSSPNMSENEESGRDENGEVPHLSRYTFLENPPQELENNTMTLETARKHQEAKSLADQIQSTAEKPSESNKDEKSLVTPDSPRLSVLYESDDLNSTKPTPMSSKENSLSRCQSHPVPHLLFEVAKLLASVPLNNDVTTVMTKPIHVDSSNDDEMTSVSSHASNSQSNHRTNHVGGRATDSSSPKDERKRNQSNIEKWTAYLVLCLQNFKKGWKRKSPAHKRKENKQQQSPQQPETKPKEAAVLTKVLRCDNAADLNDVVTGSLLSMTSQDSAVAHNNVAQAVAAYQACGDLVQSSHSANYEDDFLAYLDPCNQVAQFTRKQPNTAAMNRAFKDDNESSLKLHQSTSPANSVVNPSTRASTPGPGPSSNRYEMVRKRGHSRNLSDGRQPISLDYAAKVLQTHKTPAERAKEASQDPELCRLPAPEARRARKKSEIKIEDVERPNSLAISIARPRPNQQVQPVKICYNQSVSRTEEKNQKQLVSPERNQNKLHHKNSLQNYEINNQFQPQQHNRQMSNNNYSQNFKPIQMVSKTNMNVHTHTADHLNYQQKIASSLPYNQSGQPVLPATMNNDPFDIEFPQATLNKSLKKAEPLEPRSPIAKSSGQKSTFGVSLLDTPMGEDKDIRPAITTQQLSSQVQKVTFADLEKEFLS